MNDKDLIEFAQGRGKTEYTMMLQEKALSEGRQLATLNLREYQIEAFNELIQSCVVYDEACIYDRRVVKNHCLQSPAQLAHMTYNEIVKSAVAYRNDLSWALAKWKFSQSMRDLQLFPSVSLLGCDLCDLRFSMQMALPAFTAVRASCLLYIYSMQQQAALNKHAEKVRQQC